MNVFHLKVLLLLAVLASLPVYAMTAAEVTGSEVSDRISKGKQYISIEYDPAFNKQQKNQIYQWLNTVTDALLTVYGELPAEHFIIRVKQSSRSYEAVPWGQVLRQSPPVVLLEINTAVGFREIANDWTAYHELSHLLIPYQGYGDLWFSEGLASYYQNIIQARNRSISEVAMWQNIGSGFERGRNENNWPGQDLTEISSNMYRYGEFMRVHWSGVHYWLKADVALREKTGNTITIDTLLKDLRDCCEGQSMTAREIAVKLDELSDSRIFTPLFAFYQSSFAMPDYRPIFRDLGIEMNPETSMVTLLQDAPHSETRNMIYRRY